MFIQQIVQVSMVLRKTALVGGDRRFDTLSCNHPQNQVKSTYRFTCLRLNLLRDLKFQFSFSIVYTEHHLDWSLVFLQKPWSGSCLIFKRTKFKF